MIIPYHEDLLQKSIPINYFDNLSSRFEYVNNELLTSGLHYPDVPCNDVVITKPKNEVKYLNYNTCRIPLPLLYLFDEEGNGLKQTVQSHRGRQAIGHSMTYDPSIKMIDLRQKILRRLEILYMLALEDDSLIAKCKKKKCDICYKTFFSNYTCLPRKPNIFWVGQILHCIQDSYSRVHTLRTLPNQTAGRTPNTNDFSNKETTLLSFKLVKMIGDVVDANQIESGSVSTTEDIVAFLLKSIPEPELQRIVRKNPNDISHIFTLTLFFKNQKKRILELYGNSPTNLPSKKNEKNHKSALTNYPYLLSFRFIDHQKKCGRSFHMSYDTEKESIIFQPFIIKNCTDVLTLFKQHILDSKKSITVKIEEMIDYLAANVFPIRNDYKNQPSAKLCYRTPCECDLSYENVYRTYQKSSGDKKIHSKKHKQSRKRYVSKTRSKRT